MHPVNLVGPELLVIPDYPVDLRMRPVDPGLPVIPDCLVDLQMHPVDHGYPDLHLYLDPP